MAGRALQVRGPAYPAEERRDQEPLVPGVPERLSGSRERRGPKIVGPELEDFPVRSHLASVPPACKGTAVREYKPGRAGASEDLRLQAVLLGEPGQQNFRISREVRLELEVRRLGVRVLVGLGVYMLVRRPQLVQGVAYGLQILLPVYVSHAQHSLVHGPKSYPKL